ncbi:phage tail assembly protein [Chelativorans intermedius]|uniref:Phage tail assembly protein n=1 Tax=Chelativorans intermedius TaxID=515947 RepID=A0ABV6D7I4_9HYPH|nr:phage tail assembly protein [Chelativorans intermedius]MCT8999224.1 phage tail assembly protein [Chelativorans intermedius]
MNWKTVTHTLKFPLQFEGRKIEKITLREPDVEALEKIDELDIQPGKPVRVRQMRGMIAALGDCPPEALGKLHRDDLAALGELLGPLLEGEPETAAAS